jgi:hypothetical protein
MRPLHPRKPLRRTAWALLICGMVATFLQLAVGVLAVTHGGSPVGPGHEAVWPNGQTMTLNRVPGGIDSTPAYTTRCVLTSEDRAAEPPVSLPIGEPVRRETVGDVRVSCDENVALLTGTPMAIADLARGPLIGVPLFVVFLGILFFFPRFTFLLARNRLGDAMLRAMRVSRRRD